MIETLLFILGVLLGVALGYAIRAAGEQRRARSRCFYRRMLAEVLETLCTLCLYLSHGEPGHRNRFSEQMFGHFEPLNYFSRKLRSEEEEY